jgi:manganese/zinc/iron transport system permease protein
MSAMVVAPAAAARQWTNRLVVMAGLAALFGGVSGMSGAVISSTRTGLSTGPVIVVCMSAIAIFSLLLAPERGLIWGWLQQQRNTQRLQQETILIDLQLLELQHPNERRGHSAAALEAMNVGLASVRPTLKRLIENKLAREIEVDRWVLTEAGSAEASRLLRETNFAQLALTQSNVARSSTL